MIEYVGELRGKCRVMCSHVFSIGGIAMPVLILDIDASGNEMDDGNRSSMVVGSGTDVVVEVFVGGLEEPIIGGELVFDTDVLTVKSVTVTGEFFVLGASGKTVTIGSFPPGISLPEGYLPTVTLTTASDVTDKEFVVSASMNMADATNIGQTDMITVETPLTFNAFAMPDPMCGIGADFNRDGSVDFGDFLLFAGSFGTNDNRYDLNNDGVVDFSDFLLFLGYWGMRVD